MNDKADLRKAALAARAEAHKNEERRSDLTATLRSFLAVQSGVIAGYWPIRSEADPRPALAAYGGSVCLPVVIAPATPLVFREWQPDEGDAWLDKGAYGTAHPNERCAEMTPNLVLLPLVGFDRDGNRLGYGGGFYDRTLAALRANGHGEMLAVGVAYSAQQVAAIPTEPTDIPLDLLVSEAGLQDFRLKRE